MRFPKDETSTIALAQLVANGIQDNPTIFPNPPILPASLLTGLTAYNAKTVEIQAAEAKLRQFVQEKNIIYDVLRRGTRDSINYSKIIARGDDAILALVGWGKRADAVALQPPGQSRYFEIIGQGDGFVRFDWKEPIDGGEVAVYNVMRSEDGANFVIAGTFPLSEGAVFDQPKGKKLVYHVVGINKAGASVPSNSVTVVL